MGKGKGHNNSNHNNGHHKQVTNQGPTKWTTGDVPKTCTNCDWVPKEEQAYELLFHPDVYSAIYWMCDNHKEEWQLLLTGTIQGGNVYCTGYYTPKQETGPSYVKNLDCIDDVFIKEHDVVAGIHSHGDMAVFYSATDDEMTNHSLIKHNAVINNKYEIEAKSRVDLPCGMVKFVKSHVKVLIPRAAKVEGYENVTKRTYTYSNPGWTAQGFTGHGQRQSAASDDYWKQKAAKAACLINGFVRQASGIYVHHHRLTYAELGELGYEYNNMGELCLKEVTPPTDDIERLSYPPQDYDG